MKKGPGRHWMWLVLFLCIVWSGDASAWWHEQWQYRQKISFDTTATGSDIKENLHEFPLLIRLHAANFNFNNCMDNGEDIRFVAGDDKAQLKHHIERFDILDQMALIWVKVTRLPGSSNQDYMYMYYGNKEAVGGMDAAGTYDAKYSAVFHFAEVDQPPQDASSRKNNPAEFSGGQGLPGVIGNGLMLNGTTDKMVLASLTALDFSGGFTFSTWIRLSYPVTNAYLFSMESEGKEVILSVDGTRLSCHIQTDPEKIYATEESIDLPLNEWHHVAATVASQGRISLYLDGIEAYFMNFPSAFPTIEGNLVIGGSAQNAHLFLGDLDEVQVSNVARSSDWIRALFASEGQESAMINVGQEELGGGGGMPVFYLKTVLKNISLDGWVIIVLLIIFSGLSWFVFLTKAFFIRMAEREDREFMEAYEKLENLVGMNKIGDDQFQNSSLYRLYKAGCEKLMPLATVVSANPGNDACLNEREMNKFKAALDKGYVDETRKLNSGLVLLTMAISGGPFLGLLGTVWGVMNTFAAMAEAGEASIMAIAPGVASALSTTVFGLIVAIPALFSYNYLLSKVKNITAELGVFIDYLTLKAEETYGSKG